jgi:hypothetical protein
MLKSTATKEVTGSWRSGPHQGNWSLKDLRQPARRWWGLLQLRILRFRCDKDGNVRVGILPQREEILIGRLGFGSVALQDIGAGEAEMRECGDGLPRRKLTRTFPTRDSH